MSQFTLYGDTVKGRRPSYVGAARPEQAEPLVDQFVESLRDLGATSRPAGFRTDDAGQLCERWSRDHSGSET